MRKPKLPKRWGLAALMREDILNFIEARPWSIDLYNPDMQHSLLFFALLPFIDDCWHGGPPWETCLVIAALYPDMEQARSESHMRQFAQLYGEQPDLVLALLQFIRSKLNWNPSESDEWIIRKFLRLDTEFRKELPPVRVSDKAEAIAAAIHERTGRKVSPDSVRKTRQTLAKEDEGAD